MKWIRIFVIPAALLVVAAFALITSGQRTAAAGGSGDRAQEEGRDETPGENRTGSTEGVRNGGKPRAGERGAGRGRHRRGAPGVGGRFVAPAPDEVEFLEVTLDSAQRRLLQSAVEATGVLTANPDLVARVGPVIPGRVSEVLVGLGDRVQAGQPMAKLVSAEIGQAVSEYYKAQAELELATINYERYQRLINQEIGARKDLLAAEADYKIAQASCTAAEKTLHAFGFTEADVKQISSTHTINAELLLRAPITGTVVERSVTIGERVGEDSALFTVMDLGRLFVDAQVYERDVAGLREGQRTEVTVSACPGEAHEGEVVHVGRVVDPETRTLIVRTEIANPEGLLRVGMLAAVRIFTGEECPVVSVPLEAVLDENGNSYVFVPHDDGYLLKPVVTGCRDARWVAVLDGLSEADPVVVGGAYGLYSMLKQSAGDAVHIH